jgi:GxxExxY protein
MRGEGVPPRPAVLAKLASRGAHENTKARNHEVKIVMVQHEFEPLSSAVIGAAIDVHSALGPGFLESTYGSALKVALTHRQLRFEVERPLAVKFEGVEVGVGRLDFLVEGALVVELKAVETLHATHFAQLRAYLKGSGCRIGLLFNFNSPTLVVRRVVHG